MMTILMGKALWLRPFVTAVLTLQLTQSSLLGASSCLNIATVVISSDPSLDWYMHAAGFMALSMRWAARCCGRADSAALLSGFAFMPEEPRAVTYKESLASEAASDRNAAALENKLASAKHHLQDEAGPVECQKKS